MFSARSVDIEYLIEMHKVRIGLILTHEAAFLKLSITLRKAEEISIIT